MRRFVVLRVSDELLKIAADLPEAIMCGVCLGDRLIAGPEVLLKTENETEVRDLLPSLKEQCDENHHIVVLRVTN